MTPLLLLNVDWKHSFLIKLLPSSNCIYASMNSILLHVASNKFNFSYLLTKTYKKLHSLWRQTVNHHVSTGKCIFGKCFLWITIIIIESMTLNMHQSHVDLVLSNSDKFHYNTSMHSRSKWENGSRVLMWPHVVSLWLNDWVRLNVPPNTL